jgi:hypothetical protein
MRDDSFRLPGRMVLTEANLRGEQSVLFEWVAEADKTLQF